MELLLAGKLETTQPQLAPFPSIPAELPGINVAEAKNAHATDIAEQEEAEELEVVENTDLDREMRHMTFGQRGEALEDYDIEDVDMVPLDGLNKQHFIYKIRDNQEPNKGSVHWLINKMDQIQNEMDNQLDEIQAITQTEPLTPSSNHTTGGQ